MQAAGRTEKETHHNMLLGCEVGTKPETANQRAYRLGIGKPTGCEL